MSMHILTYYFFCQLTDSDSQVKIKYLCFFYFLHKKGMILVGRPLSEVAALQLIRKVVELSTQVLGCFRHYVVTITLYRIMKLNVSSRGQTLVQKELIAHFSANQ